MLQPRNSTSTTELIQVNVHSNISPSKNTSKRDLYPIRIFDEKRVNLLVDRLCAQHTLTPALQSFLQKLMKLDSITSETMLKIYRLYFARMSVDEVNRFVLPDNCEGYLAELLSTEDVPETILNLLEYVLSNYKIQANILIRVLPALALSGGSPSHLRTQFLLLLVSTHGQTLTPRMWSLVSTVANALTHDDVLCVIQSLFDKGYANQVQTWPQLHRILKGSPDTALVKSYSEIFIKFYIVNSYAFSDEFIACLVVHAETDDKIAAIVARLEVSKLSDVVAILISLEIDPEKLNQIAYVLKALFALDGVPNSFYALITAIIKRCQCGRKPHMCIAKSALDAVAESELKKIDMNSLDASCGNRLFFDLRLFDLHADNDFSFVIRSFENSTVYDTIIASFTYLKCKRETISRNDVVLASSHLCPLLKHGKLGAYVTTSISSPSFRKGDLYSAAYTTLYYLYAEVKEWDRKFLDEIVCAFMAGLQKSGGSSTQICIHALSLLACENQLFLARYMPQILIRLSQITSTFKISIHILEYLLLVSYIPDLFRNFVENDYRMVLQIALVYVHDVLSTRNSRADQGHAVDPSFGEYNLSQAYSVIVCWYNNMRIGKEKMLEFIENGFKSYPCDENDLCLDLLINPRTMLKEIPATVFYTTSNSILAIGNSLGKCVAYEIKPSGSFAYDLELDGPKNSMFARIVDKNSLKITSTQFSELNMKNSFTLRAIKVLDKTPNIDLHKIAVVYVGPEQNSEKDILRNSSGSSGYNSFLLELGDFVALRGTDRFTGGLDTSGDTDGKFAVVWNTSSFQVVYHVSTLMPLDVSDVNFILKKKHIGNDYVTIVWNDDSSDYVADAIPSQFNWVQIVIKPILEKFVVTVLKKDHIKIEFVDEKIFHSVPTMAKYVRYAAVNFNLFAQIYNQIQRADHYTSNMRERQKQILKICQGNFKSL